MNKLRLCPTCVHARVHNGGLYCWRVVHYALAGGLNCVGVPVMDCDTEREHTPPNLAHAVVYGHCGVAGDYHAAE